MGVLFEGWLLLGTLTAGPPEGGCHLALEVRGQRALAEAQEPRDAVSGRLDRVRARRLGGLLDLWLGPGETRRVPIGRGEGGRPVVLEARLASP